jgi:hypothetical protein
LNPASLVSGSLASTPAYSAKVSTCPQDGSPATQHLICLYIPDVYDKDAVTEVNLLPKTHLLLTFLVIKVMKILLSQHGLNLTGVKSNLYTAIGMASCAAMLSVIHFL